ncbi:MAG: hypothetical protein ACK5GA_08060 [Holosporaceae bacterium]|jgi:hypothetical protein
MTAFSSAIQTLFNDQNLAVNATFIPQIGVSKAVRVMTRAPDVYQNIGQSVIETPSLVLEVQVADCPIVSQGDQFIINSAAYTVQGDPRRDSDRLYWQVDCYAS